MTTRDKQTYSSPLLRALANREPINVIKQILDNDPRVDFGHVAVHLACRYSTMDMMALIIQRGGLVNAWDEDGRTPLGTILLDSTTQLFDKIHYLLSHGADSSLSTSNRYRSTPFRIALFQYDDKDSLYMLDLFDSSDMNRIIKDDLFHWNKQSDSMLTKAIRRDVGISRIEWLLKHGADISVEASSNQTVFSLIKSTKNGERIRTALERSSIAQALLGSERQFSNALVKPGRDVVRRIIDFL